MLKLLANGLSRLVIKPLPIAPDKQMHFWGGLFFAAAVTFIFGIPLYGLYATTVAGLAKEVYDWVDNQWQELRNLPKQHGVEFMDFFATTVGGAISTILFYLVERFVL